MDNQIHQVNFQNSKTVQIYDLYQWDVGQVLKFDNLFPNGTEVQFSDGSVKVIVDGQITIPDHILQVAGREKCWVQVIGEDHETTVYKISFNIVARPKKKDYIEPEDHETFREQIQALVNQAGEISKEAMQEASAMSQEAFEKASELTQAAMENAAEIARQAEETGRQAKEAGDRAAEIGHHAEEVGEQAQRAAEAASALAGDLNAKIAEVEAVKAETEKFKDAAADSAQDAELFAAIAHQGAAEKGFMYVEGEADGHLYLYTENTSGIKFEDNEGRLMVVYE